MIKKSALTLALIASLGFSAHAADAVELLVTIDSGTTMSQGAALVLAGQALEQKAKVRVLLCGAGGDIGPNAVLTFEVELLEIVKAAK